MENVPFYIYASFTLVLVTTLYLFYRAAQKPKSFLVLGSCWIFVQSVLGISGFYTNSSTFAPRLQFLLLPPLVFIVLQFSTLKGRLFIDCLNLKLITLIHIIRIPVEIILYWLFIHHAIPELMTFEGRNFDLFSGISAPFIYYFGYIKGKLNRAFLIGWNVLCLGLLINVVVNSILSAPTPFQQFAFEQPNIAILYFPFLFLPALIVPIILFSHLASIRQLIWKK